MNISDNDPKRPYQGQRYNRIKPGTYQKDIWYELGQFVRGIVDKESVDIAYYLNPGQKPIVPFDVNLTTTAVNISALGGTNGINLFKKSHYLIVEIKDNGTANIINLSFPNSTSSIQLTGNFAYYEWSHPAFLDLTGLQAFTDTGTAIITVSGVAF